MSDSPFMPSFAVYGAPPSELVSIPTEAIQCSPLVPGAAALDECTEATLTGLAMAASPGTIERRYAIATGLKALAPGAPFTILAPKDKGGTRLAKELKAFGCAIEDESRRHYRTCTGIRPAVLQGVEEAIAEGGPQFVKSTGLWSQPGIFSWNKVDTGSALLLSHLPILVGKGADFGAGLGYLAKHVLQSAGVTELHLIDIDRRAMSMAKKNVEDASVQFHWADIRNAPPALPLLDFVVMNPPFHDGGSEDRALGLAFIQRAATALRAGGSCWLTANRHLPYEEVLQESFGQVNLKIQEGGFKIYEAIK